MIKNDFMNSKSVVVIKPEPNKFDYEEDSDGWWAYLTECPTTRTFGKTKQDSFRNLIVLLHRCNE